MTQKRRRRRKKSKAQFLGPHGRWFTYNFLSFLSLSLTFMSLVCFIPLTFDVSIHIIIIRFHFAEKCFNLYVIVRADRRKREKSDEEESEKME